MGDRWECETDADGLRVYGDDADVVGDIPDDVVTVKVDKRKSSTGSQVKENFAGKRERVEDRNRANTGHWTRCFFGKVKESITG